VTAHQKTVGPPAVAAVIAEARRILETSPVLVFVPGGQATMAWLCTLLERSDVARKDAEKSVTALRETVERMQSENHRLREENAGLRGDLAQLAGALAPEKG